MDNVAADQATRSSTREGSAWVRDFPGAPDLGWDPDPALSDRQRLDHRRELRGLDLLRAPASESIGLPRLLLSLHGQQLLSRAGVVGSQLDHVDVPARKLG